MKKFIGNIRTTMQQYWRHLMGHSDEKKMSRGAEDISKTMTSPHGENWRRKEKKK